MLEHVQSSLKKRHTLDFEDGRKVDLLTQYLGSFPFRMDEQVALDAGQEVVCRKDLHPRPSAEKKDELIGRFITNVGTGDIYRITKVVSDLSPGDHAVTIGVVKDGKEYPLTSNVTQALSRLNEKLSLGFQPDDLGFGGDKNMKRIVAEVLNQRDSLLEAGSISEAEVRDLETYIEKRSIGY